MIVIFGSGYIGTAFQKELAERRMEFGFIYGGWKRSFIELAAILQARRAELVINASAYIPKPSVSLCDDHQEETIRGNLMFPARLAHACEMANVPLAHISTACLFDDAKEYSESDTPTRGFDSYCGTYLGVKLLAEEAVRDYHNTYIWRIRLPFDEFDSNRNYLSKLARYPQVFDHINSLTHRADFVKAALDMWKLKADFGTYHCVNPGSISAREIVARMLSKGIIKKEPEFTYGPSAGGKLSTDRLLATGVKIRPVEDAVNEAIDRWVPAS